MRWSARETQIHESGLSRALYSDAVARRLTTLRIQPPREQPKARQLKLGLQAVSGSGLNLQPSGEITSCTDLPSCICWHPETIEKFSSGSFGRRWWQRSERCACNKGKDSLGPTANRPGFSILLDKNRLRARARPSCQRHCLLTTLGVGAVDASHALSRSAMRSSILPCPGHLASVCLTMTGR